MAADRYHHRTPRHYRKGTRSRRAKKSEGGAIAMTCVEARGLRKVFKTTPALDGIDLRIEEGRILGLIGPNGAGKTTALNAILGLTPFEGELTVLGRDPWSAREQLMRDVSFIADVAVLPRWMRVADLLDYMATLCRWSPQPGPRAARLCPQCPLLR